MEIIFTKRIAVKTSAPEEIVPVMMAENYTITHAEASGCGEYLGNCETCGLPIFEKDKYNVDTDSVYWHQECPGEKGNE